MGGRALGGAGIRDMLADDRVWCVLGTVALHDGETGHYEVNDDGDLQVTVVSHQHGVPITAILGGAFGSAAGTWTVPAAGDEVLVCFADGDFEGDAVVVAVTSSRSAPAGLAPGTVLVRADDRVQADAPEVLLGGGAGHEPALQADAYRSAEDTLLDGLVVCLTAIAAATTPPTAGAVTTFEGVITAFQAAANAAKTTVTKVK
jgi:hypothetical protein